LTSGVAFDNDVGHVLSEKRLVEGILRSRTSGVVVRYLLKFGQVV
jgi:hypothetical protein